MAEYIDRNYIVKAYIDLCKALSQKSKICPGADEPTVKNVFAIVMHAPAADVVEVVRCKNCFYYKPFGECNNTGSTVKPDDYCSYGARMDKEDET